MFLLKLILPTLINYCMSAGSNHMDVCSLLMVCGYRDVKYAAAEPDRRRLLLLQLHYFNNSNSTIQKKRVDETPGRRHFT